MALVLLRQPAQAEQELAETVQKFPDFRPARLNLGLARWMQQKHDAALDDFAAVLLKPQEQALIEAAYYRGQVYLDRARAKKTPDDLRLAMREFDQVIQERPNFLFAYLARAQTHCLQGNPSQALGELNLLLAAAQPDFKTDSAEASHLRGRLLWRMVPGWRLPKDTHDEAMALARGELEQAIARGRRVPLLYDDLGSVLTRLGKTDDAIAAYSQGIELAPEDLSLRIKRGWPLADVPGKSDAAQEDFKTAVRLDPSNAEAHAGLGYAQAMGKLAEPARAEAMRALLNADNNPILLRYIACIYARLSESDEQRRSEYQDLAMALLQKGVRLAGANEISAINKEPALDSLKGRPDYKQLLESTTRPNP
jgi:tetratricopeptide (TPR) repeat protein